LINLNDVINAEKIYQSNLLNKNVVQEKICVLLINFISLWRQTFKNL